MRLAVSMSEENGLEEIQKLIDDIQARLVELFDQFRELRIRLGQKPLGFAPSLVSEPSPAEQSPTEDARPEGTSPATIKEDIEEPTLAGSTKQALESDVRVSRLLDPISHELSTGSSPAEIIAEYLQAAKDELIPKETQNEKVARDIDIVLKFLRARGRRSIRPEERDNILRRIKRWKAHLSK